MTQAPLLVLVDGSNIAHAARWLEAGDGDRSLVRAGKRLVDRCAAAAAANGWEVLVTFDGSGPFGAVGERQVSPACLVVATGRASADDLLATQARAAHEEGRRYWLATNDRGLRDVAGVRAERVLGARALLAQLGSAGAGGAERTQRAGDEAQAGFHLRDRISGDVRALLERLRRGG